ncbi:MAG: UDP-glucose/GDP-mannose dehydrogenase family protein [Fibrobacteraceae bacterium]|nr:UDP-glucose/GDP-mannose dehydrogenase family protein [Fibrobacteraceae bacterium]
MSSISIFGLGYVGCVGIGCFAKLGHKVVGCDVDLNKVERINKGLPTIVERDIDDLMKEGFDAGLISATMSAEEAVAQTEISFLCVGTPNAANGQLDTSYLVSAARSIGVALRNKTLFHTVVIRSTVPPGTNATIAGVIEKASGRVVNKDFAVVSNPEFLREGSAVKDFLNPPITVIGSQNSVAVKILRSLYEPFGCEIAEVPEKVAEIIKFVNNSYHALKVAFGNEVGAICKTLGIDSHIVMNLFCKDTSLNISPYYFKPGFAYGGSCLPKDLKGLNYIAHSNNVKVPILESIECSNDKHIIRAIELAKSYGCKNVGVIGLTFKAGTDDLRNSASTRLAEALIGAGYNVSIYDRFLNIAREKETNLTDLNKRIPHLLPLLKINSEDVVKNSSLVVITVRNPEIPELVRKYPNVRFIDLDRVKDSSVESLANYEGFCW